MNFKTGKLPYKEDKRTAQLRDFIDLDLRPPIKYDFDRGRSSFPHNVWGNNNYGDCVFAAETNHMLRLERAEQRRTLKMTDAEVIAKYLSLTGGVDEGFVMLDAFNIWRQEGWNVGKRNYKIDGFGELQRTDRRQLRLGCYLFHGVEFGFDLPLTAQQGTREGVWDYVGGAGSEPGSWAGHAVYAKKYDDGNFYALSWGMEIRVTNTFIETYCDEVWAVVDALDVWRKHPAFDVQKFESYLSQTGAQTH